MFKYLRILVYITNHVLGKLLNLFFEGGIGMWLRHSWLKRGFFVLVYYNGVILKVASPQVIKKGILCLRLFGWRYLGGGFAADCRKGDFLFKIIRMALIEEGLRHSLLKKGFFL